MENKNKEIFTRSEKITALKQLALCFCILVIVSLFGLSFKPVKKDKPLEIQDTSLNIIKIEDKTIPYIDISAEYPTQGTGSLYVANSVQDIIKTFKDNFDFSKATKEDLENAGLFGDRRYQLYITYAVTSGAHTISHRVTTYTFTGGAHGNTFVETYTFNAQEKLLSLSDIFIDLPNALKILSKKSIDSINGNSDYKDGIDQTWLAEGTSPEEKNFSAFEITKDSFVIIFQQYQVAAYVYGNIEVRIPLAELADVLKPEFK